MKITIFGVSLLVGLAGLVTGQQATTDAAAALRAKVHSQLYSANSTEKIPDQLARTSGQTLNLVSDHDSGMGGEPSNAPPYPPYRLVAMSCGSDLAVVATAISSTSHMTADQTFLYSDWTFDVEEVLKNNVKDPIGAGQLVVATRPGGQLSINGRTVIATEQNFGAFESGKKYLLYMEYIPATKAYKAIAEKTFVLSGDRPGHVTQNVHYPTLETETVITLLTDSRAAAAAASTNPYCVGGEKSQ